MKSNESEDKKSIVGYVGLTSGNGSNYGMIMQTEFNLKKDDSAIINSYFLNKVAFLKKDGDSWKLDQEFVWKEDALKDKKSDEILSSHFNNYNRWWSLNASYIGDYLFDKFGFKGDQGIWKTNDNQIDFESLKEKIIFFYENDKWYKKESKAIEIDDKETYNPPKGTFSKKTVNYS